MEKGTLFSNIVMSIRKRSSSLIIFQQVFKKKNNVNVSFGQH